MRIAIDIDGVLAQFSESFAKLLNANEPGVVPDGFKFTSWGWPDTIRKGLEDTGWGLVRETENFWTTLEPYEDNLEALRKFLVNNRDVEVFYVTSRTPSAGRSTLFQSNTWLTSQGVRVRNSTTIVMPYTLGKGHPITKGQLYRDLAIDASIDDYPKNIHGALQASLDYRTGHTPFLLDRPWNERAGELDAFRVASLKEYLNLIVIPVADR